MINSINKENKQKYVGIIANCSTIVTSIPITIWLINVPWAITHINPSSNDLSWTFFISRIVFDSFELLLTLKHCIFFNQLFGLLALCHIFFLWIDSHFKRCPSFDFYWILLSSIPCLSTFISIVHWVLIVQYLILIRFVTVYLIQTVWNSHITRFIQIQFLTDRYDPHLSYWMYRLIFRLLLSLTLNFRIMQNLALFVAFCIIILNFSTRIILQRLLLIWQYKCLNWFIFLFMIELVLIV